MNVSRLEKHLVELIKEEQVKLGYQRESIHLYYPLTSLNHLLKTSYDVEMMQCMLQEYGKCGKSILGELCISHKKDRFCILIPEEGVEYVYTHTEEQEFLKDFIDAIRKHSCTIEEIQSVFNKYSDKVYFERVAHGEFDYLLYFEDGTPDEFLYCITEEGPHMIYHRFMPEDYEDFSFSDS